MVPDELKSPETTGKWEKALERIAKGAMDPERFMGSIVRYVDYIVKRQQPEKRYCVSQGTLPQREENRQEEG